MDPHHAQSDAIPWFVLFSDARHPILVAPALALFIDIRLVLPGAFL